MGQLTDTLRATLRDLAQADARLYRGLQEELSDTTATSSSSDTRLAGDVPASREDLEALSVAALWSLCKARGIKRLSNGPKPQQIEALLCHPDGPPLRGNLPRKATKGTKTSKSAAVGANAADMQALEHRLDRLERLVLLIAHQVGVTPEAIEGLGPLASPGA